MTIITVNEAHNSLVVREKTLASITFGSLWSCSDSNHMVICVMQMTAGVHNIKKGTRKKPKDQPHWLESIRNMAGKVQYIIVESEDLIQVCCYSSLESKVDVGFFVSCEEDVCLSAV